MHFIHFILCSFYAISLIIFCYFSPLFPLLSIRKTLFFHHSHETRPLSPGVLAVRPAPTLMGSHVWERIAQSISIHLIYRGQVASEHCRPQTAGSTYVASNQPFTRTNYLLWASMIDSGQVLSLRWLLRPGTSMAA